MIWVLVFVGGVLVGAGVGAVAAFWYINPWRHF